MRQLMAGPSSYFQLCWLYRAATLLSECDGHSVLGELDVIPADKDTNTLASAVSFGGTLHKEASGQNVQS